MLDEPVMIHLRPLLVVAAFVPIGLAVSIAATPPAHACSPIFEIYETLELELVERTTEGEPEAAKGTAKLVGQGSFLSLERSDATSNSRVYFRGR